MTVPSEMDSRSRGYVYTNLSAALRDSSSPLRSYLDRTFPHMRGLQDRYRTNAGPLEVPGRGVSPVLIGVAFDLVVRIRLVPDHVPTIALLAFGHQPARQAVIRQLAQGAGESARRDDVEGLARACWALALCVQVYRDGRIEPGSGLYGPVRSGDFTVPNLLAVAPAAGVIELGELDALARTRLVPRLRGPYRPGPTFAGSALCAADADLIADRTLIDIKTRIGPMGSRTHERSDRLPGNDIRQLVAYALFDSSDRYQLSEIGIYSARYGNLTTWPLGETLDLLAGRRVDVREERATIWRLLGGG